MQDGWVYILAQRYRGALYTGVTSDIARRIREHRNSFGSITSSARHQAHRLDGKARRHPDGIAREKSVKRWRRERNFNINGEHNPDWRDLSGDL